MIKSMTGYGREQQLLDGRDILVEIRSVNHRFYEFSARVPRVYGYLEERLKTFLQGKIARGKVEVAVSIFAAGGKEADIAVNTAVVEGYLSALRGIRASTGLADDLALSDILRLPDAFVVTRVEEKEEDVWNAVRTVAAAALDTFIAMREAEGRRLKDDILAKVQSIAAGVERIEARSPAVTDAYRERLYAKLCEVLADTAIDPQRLLTEAAIFAEKTAVDEETVRLKSHIHQMTDMLESGEAVGRKLDFLVQEFNREANTIGSKAQDLETTRLVVDMKSDIEKIREQVQNIE